MDPPTIIVWMIFAILQCIALAGLGLLGILAFSGAATVFDSGEEVTTILIVFSVYMIALFIFEIWTIIVAKRARQEIADGTAPTNDTDIPKV